jgi:hypothetical protein
MLKTYKVVGLFSAVLGMGSYALWHSALPDDIQLYSQTTMSKLGELKSHTADPLKEFSSEEKKTDFYLPQQISTTVRPHSEGNGAEVGDPAQSIPEFSNDEDRITWARKIIFTGTSVQKFCALQAIFDQDPSEAAKNLIELMQTAKTSDADTEFLIQGILFMENQKSVLSDGDLTYFYENGNSNLQKTIVKILADRGDPSLLNAYLSKTSPLLQSDDPQERVNTLRAMGSLNNPAVIPFALKALNDADPQVKIDALEIVATLGTEVDSTTIQTLLTDENPRVRLQAQRTLNNLQRKVTLTNSTQANSQQIAGLPDHGFPAAIAEITNKHPTEMSEPTNNVPE